MQNKDRLLQTGMLSGISETEARFKNPLVLAYIGDTVYDLYIRCTLVKNSGAGINELHKRACTMVNARAQARAAKSSLLFSQKRKRTYSAGEETPKAGYPKTCLPRITMPLRGWRP